MAVALRSVGTRGTTALGVPTGTTTERPCCSSRSRGRSTPPAQPHPAPPAARSTSSAGLAIAGTTTGRYTATLWRFATTSESGTYTITAPSGGTVATAEAFAFSGVDPASTPYLATGSALAGSTASANTSPAVNGTIANTNDYGVVATSTSGVSVTISSAPTGTTEIGATASSIMHVFGGTFASGATGSLSATLSTAVTNRSAILVALTAAVPVVNISLTGTVSDLTIAAPAGTVSASSTVTNVTLTGTVSDLTTAAPAGTAAAATNVTLTGTVSDLTTAAPAGSPWPSSATSP
jgi:hypothetical protein